MPIALSTRAQQIGDSPTLKINATARALKAAGKPVIHLGGGEPTYPAPASTVEALSRKIQTRKIKYTPSSGTPELKTAILEYMRKHYAHTFTEKQVLACAGAKQALFNFLLATINPGDEVVFPAPFWVSYPEMVKLAGGVPVIVHPANKMCATAQEVLQAVTPRTKAILINSPCNPTGHIFEETFIKQIVQFAQESKIFLVMDDIYHQLVFDGFKVPNPCAYATDFSNLVIVNGVSKLYGLTGLRIGWAVSENEDLIAAMGRLQAQSTSCNSDLGEVGATAALLGDQGCVKDLCSILEDNRNTLLREIQKIPHLQVVPAQSTFYCFVDFSHYNADSDALAAYLLEKALVAVVPGRAFGAEGYLRISFCADKPSIVEGIRRIRWALDNSAPNEIKIGDKIVKRNEK